MICFNFGRSFPLWPYFRDEKKRLARKGKGSTHQLFTTHLGGLEKVELQMPKACLTTSNSRRESARVCNA